MVKQLIRILTITVLFLSTTCSHKNKTQIEEQYMLLRDAKNKSELSKAKNYVTDSLDFAALDTLSIRTVYLNGWVILYKNNISDLSTDSKKIINRLYMESPASIPGFIQTIVKSNALADHPGVAASIAAYPHGIDIEPDEHSEIANRLLTQTRLSGSTAPRIDGLPTITGKAIILFYESDCPSCYHITEKLIAGYTKLKDRGVDVISIASDTEPEQYEKYSSRLPWQHKLCDFQGFFSPNFERWGVAATPVVYIVDKGIVRLVSEKE